MLKKGSVCLALALATLSVSEDVWACSNHYTQGGEVFGFPDVGSDQAFPVNVLVLDAHQEQRPVAPPGRWILERDGDSMELTFSISDQFSYGEGSYSSTARWWKPDRALSPGDVLVREGCDDCAPTTVVEADLEPPDAPVASLRDLYLQDEENLCFGEVRGRISLNLDIEDTEQARESFLAKVFVGDTAEEAAQATRPFNVQVSRASTHILSLTTVDETAATLSLERPFCVSVALVDLAGNEGPRSESLCVDPQRILNPEPEPNPEDATTAPVCSVSPWQRPLTPLTVLLAFLGLLWARIRRTRGHEPARGSFGR